MRLILCCFFLSFQIFAQNLSPEEQRQMVEDMKLMKEKMNRLENKSAPATGLKTVNYKDETAEKSKSGSQAEAPSAAGASLTAEQTKKLLEDINTIKANQDESQKILDELEKEDK
jgi:hypothetical protein